MSAFEKVVLLKSIAPHVLELSFRAAPKSSSSSAEPVARLAPGEVAAARVGVRREPGGDEP